MSDSSSSSISEPVVRPHSALDRDAPSPLDTDVEDGHELQPGDVFAGWEVESLIGRGGMGTVYRVNRAGTKAALKILQPTYLANERYRQRFLFECQQLQTLNHPNIVRLLEFGTRGDVPYLTMELIEGTDLHTLVEERGPLPWEQATRLVLTIARGLEFARRRGLIHRDIKPENVLLQRKGRLARAKIVDFGLIKQITSEHGDENLLTLQPQDWFGVMDRFQAHMDRVLQRDWSRRRTDLEIREVLRELRDVLYTAKRIELPQDSDTSYRHRGGKATGRTGRIGQVRRSSTSGRRTTTNGRGRTRALGLTQDGECLGTPYFMAPEMWLEVPADHRADIFSLGVTWFFLLTGQYPFEGESVNDVMRSTIQSRPASLGRVDCPSDLQDVVLRMLAKLPEQRYHRYRNLIDDLQRLLNDRRPLIDFMGMAHESALMAERPKDAAEVLFDILQSFLEHANIETQAMAAGSDDDSTRDPAEPRVPRPPLAAPLNPLGPERFRDAFPGERLIGEVCLGKDVPVFETWLIGTNKAVRVFRAADRFWFLQRGPREEQPPQPMPLMMLQASMAGWQQEGPLLLLGGLQFVVMEHEGDHVRTVMQALTGTLPATVRRSIARGDEPDALPVHEGVSTRSAPVIEPIDFSLPGENDVELFTDDDAPAKARIDELAEIEDWSVTAAGPQPPPPPQSPAARTRMFSPPPSPTPKLSRADAPTEDSTTVVAGVPNTPPPPPPMSPAASRRPKRIAGESSDEVPTLPPDIPPLPDDTRKFPGGG